MKTTLSLSARHRFLAVPLLATGLLLAGCTGGAPTGDPSGEAVDMDELIELAQAEGEVVLYMGPAEEQGLEWASQFTDEYGIEIVTFSGSTQALWERFQQESRTGAHQADIMIEVDHRRFTDAANEGWIMEYTPASDADYPDDLKESGLWYGLYANADPIAWNTDQVTEEEIELLMEEEYAAFADPRFQDRIATAVPLSGGRNLRTWYRLAEDPAFGEDFLEDLAANNPVFYESGSSMTERLVAGEHAIAFGVADVQVIRAALAGAPVQMMYPHPATGTHFSMGINAGAPHPNASKLFMEWATSQESLASATSIFQAGPVYDGIEDRRDFSDLDWYEAPEDVELDWELDDQMLADQEAFVAHWSEVFNYQ
jgi:iron(III) transport system substrate-binding protein